LRKAPAVSVLSPWREAMCSFIAAADS
jgi:hypothetical protein